MYAKYGSPLFRASTHTAAWPDEKVASLLMNDPYYTELGKLDIGRVPAGVRTVQLLHKNETLSAKEKEEKRLAVGALNKCPYPLCVESKDQGHDLKDCPIIPKKCQDCSRRGHIADDHAGHDQIELEHFFQIFSPSHSECGKIWRLNNAAMPQDWNLSLYDKNWSAVQKFFIQSELRKPDPLDKDLVKAAKLTRKADKLIQKVERKKVSEIAAIGSAPAPTKSTIAKIATAASTTTITSDEQAVPPQIPSISEAEIAFILRHRAEIAAEAERERQAGIEQQFNQTLEVFEKAGPKSSSTPQHVDLIDFSDADAIEANLIDFPGDIELGNLDEVRGLAIQLAGELQDEEDEAAKADAAKANDDNDMEVDHTEETPKRDTTDEILHQVDELYPAIDEFDSTDYTQQNPGPGSPSILHNDSESTSSSGSESETEEPAR